MAFSSSSTSLSATPNITPLIDVLLVLLIIFMVIVPSTPYGLSSALPANSDQPAVIPNQAPLTVHIRPSASVAGGSVYRVDGNDLASGALADYLQKYRARNTDPAVWISGDPRLDYRAVVEVVAASQKAGIKNIGLLTAAVR